MQAGQLKQRLVFRKKIITQDQTTGRINEIWSDYCRVWGDVADLSTRDQMIASANQSVIQSRVKVRYSDLTKGIDSTMTVSFEGNTYTIIGQPARDLDSRREYLTINISLDK